MPLPTPTPTPKPDPSPDPEARRAREQARQKRRRRPAGGYSRYRVRHSEGWDHLTPAEACDRILRLLAAGRGAELLGDRVEEDEG